MLSVAVVGRYEIGPLSLKQRQAMAECQGSSHPQHPLVGWCSNHPHVGQFETAPSTLYVGSSTPTNLRLVQLNKQINYKLKEKIS